MKEKKYLKQAIDNYKKFIDDYNIKYNKTMNEIEYLDIDNIISPLFCDYYYDLCIFLNKKEEEFFNKQSEDTVKINKWIYLPPIPSIYSIKNDLDSKCKIKYKISEFDSIYFDKRLKFFNTIKDEYKDKYLKEFNLNNYDLFDTRKIKVIRIDNGNIVELFLLTSDVFGFTAAPKKIKDEKNINKYPLSRYKKCNKISDDEFINTIYDLRTIGGAFLWPTDSLKTRNCYYNLSSGVNKYLEDRVDLKLNEVLHYYNCFESSLKKYNEYKNDILYSAIFKCPMMTWLNHFKSFKNYVNYFEFNDFVELSNDKFVTINLIDNKLNDINFKDYYTKAIQNYLNSDKYSEEEKDEYIIKIVNNLKERINKRTNKIIKYL